MIETSPLDTPINRASIDQFDFNDAMEFIKRIQVRRLEALTVYQAGLRAKEEAANTRSAADMAKRLEQFAKVHTTVENGLAKLEKYAMEIQGYMMVLGAYDIKKKEDND